MPDFIDHASDNETKQTEVALANQLAANAKAKREHPFGETHCFECGAEIPEARRIALPHCCTCVDCQQLVELRAKR
ncbi:TraR/DksA C4-type zinc finger protein [Enterovibrio nigricans]|uniref:Transcriptional regulator, TraR/DksA family n=1 Tax=Enterovibrio nigricans DSM 22720 TaxID=1121868 RepID=A0A1T4UET1_9GAMM|nr:TraR/DksA C4-type zinc finger protein [Enterovibrio nigricans]SKA51194.1 transcriptional regulator, TraR/DksA family [Enterovibrio nigricans DSM 22720]